jgi:hypothetical protein
MQFMPCYDRSKLEIQGVPLNAHLGACSIPGSGQCESDYANFKSLWITRDAAAMQAAWRKGGWGGEE